jgi:hypothetical protein
LQPAIEPSYPPRMPVPLISPQATLGDLLDDNSFTLGELQSHPLASSYTPQFDAFQDRWLADQKIKDLEKQARAAKQKSKGP